MSVSNNYAAHAQADTASSSSSAPMPSSLGRGVPSAPGPVDATEARATAQNTSAKPDVPLENENVEARASLAVYGEDQVAHAVEAKHGAQLAPGQKPEEVKMEDFASDLDRWVSREGGGRVRGC